MELISQKVAMALLVGTTLVSINVNNNHNNNEIITNPDAAKAAFKVYRDDIRASRDRQFNEKESVLQKYKDYEKQLKPLEVVELLSAVGFEGEQLKQAWSIVMRESTGRPLAHNTNRSTGDNSYGIFQINMIGSLGPDRREKFNLKSNEELFNPVRNAEIAFYMSQGGKNWSSWHGMNSAAKEWYKEYPNFTK